MSNLRRTTNGFSFTCPGCGDTHVVDSGAGRWWWNSSMEKPTVQPSLEIRLGHYASHYKPGDECWCGKDYGFRCYVCHFILTDGVLDFRPDCTHALKNQQVPITAEPAK